MAATLGTWRYRGGKGLVALYRGKPAVIMRLCDVVFRRLWVSDEDAAAGVAAISRP